MMNADTTTRLSLRSFRPNEMSSPANARNTIPELSDTYLALHFQEKFEQVAKATLQESHRSRDRSSVRILPAQRACQSPIRREKMADHTEAAGPVPSGTKVRSRLVDIRKDLNTRKIFIQVAAKHPRACLNGMSANLATINQPVPTGRQHLIIGDCLVNDLTEIPVVDQLTAISFGGASVAQVIKMMELQNDERVVTLILVIGTNDVSRNPVTPEPKWEPLLVRLLNELKE